MALTREEAFFSARDGVRLFWSSDSPDVPKAHVALVHGYGDHSGRYRQVVDALGRGGYAVHAFDYRGHGQAEGRRGDCHRWTDYLEDLEQFLRRAQGRAQGKKLFVLAHSHGALMLVHRLQRDPEGIEGAILSAPYLGLAFSPPPLKVAGALALGSVVPWLSVPTGIPLEHLTSDPERLNHVRSDPLYSRTATPRWFVQSSRAQNEALGFGPKLRTPMLLLCAAEDQVASTAAARKFFDSVAASDKQLKEYPGMQHEIWNERGREQVFKDISLWIESHL